MTPSDVTPALRAIPDGVALDVKVIPGARRTQIAGMIGPRLKIRVSAPPEAGRANRALCDLLASLFDISARNVVVATGLTNPQKTIHLIGISLCTATDRLKKLITPAEPQNG